MWVCVWVGGCSACATARDVECSVILTGGARWPRPNRSHLARARLGKLLPVPSPSSNIGIFKFRKTDIIVNEPDDEAYHEFDYFSVYERVPDASACRRPDRIHSMRSDSVCVRHVIYT